MSLLQWLGIATAFMFILATRIGDEQPLAVVENSVNGTADPLSAPHTEGKRPSGGVIPQKAHSPKAVIPIDKAAFLASFRRQARDHLLPCLAGWRPSPNSVLLSGRLYHGGQLRQVKILDEQVDLPDCVSQSILEMDFATVAASLNKNSWQSIQWQIDW
jgi:hypothetical protein